MALSFEILRPGDLLVLRVDAVNLRLEASDPKQPKLVVAKAKDPAFLVVQFPPQNINEQAYLEGNPVDPAGSVASTMAGGSRLVFQLPAGTKEIPFRTDALLDWSKFNLVLSPVALGTLKAPPIPAPSRLQTAIELPYRLLLSPAEKVGWLHAPQPVTYAGRTELWHTRAGKPVTVKTNSGPKKRVVETSVSRTIPLRAIWSAGFVDHGVLPQIGKAGPRPYLAPMTPRDRAEIVILTSGTSGYQVLDKKGKTSDFVPKPVQASRLYLSSLGGWLSSRGDWTPPLPFYTPTGGSPTQVVELSEWIHVATMGRDHYVRIVDEGFLFPFGHRAAKITITERIVIPPDGFDVTYPTAYLKQRIFILVREREKRYGLDAFEFPFQHRRLELPLWKSIRIDTVVTPDIDDPSKSIASSSGTPSSFWVNVGGQGFPFHVTATDLAGKKVNFLASLIFMLDSEPDPGSVHDNYKGSGDKRLCAVTGQKIAYADPAAGDTALKTNALFFDTQVFINNPPFPVAPFLPALDYAKVTVPALEQLLGTSTPIDVQLYSDYLSTGLDSNAGVFAQVSGVPPSVQFSADKSGGFATPNLTLTALSARKGLIAGKPTDAAAGKIAPKDFFADLSAKLFGKVPLQALIPVDGSGKADANHNAPVIKTVLKPNLKNPETEIVKVTWSPQLQDYKDDPVRVTFNANNQNSVLTLQSQLTRSLKGGPSQSNINGQMTNFQVNLVGAIALTFDSLKFTSKNGQKVKVKADLPAHSPITFIGPLEFIQALADILPPGIFGGKGPSIDLKPDRIRVTYTLGLPPLSIGVFALEHVSIMTGLDLPYLDGNPAFEFAFAKRSSPFLLTVECIGGGGFVHLVLDADGIQMVEGALEFGAEVSLDLGVASGGVRIMAGIYFQLTGTSTDLTGFVDVSGNVSVLGIISISLDLNLSLSYQVSNGKKMVQGRATLTVSISVLFFSASVQISMEKSYGNNPGDPGVGDVLTPPQWALYAGAFQ